MRALSPQQSLNWKRIGQMAINVGGESWIGLVKDRGGEDVLKPIDKLQNTALTQHVNRTTIKSGHRQLLQLSRPS